MNLQLVFRNKARITLMVAILVGIHVLWDYYHGGVPTHYILAEDDMPGFSNFWGLLTLPLLTWGVITLIERKLKEDQPTNLKKEDFSEVLLIFSEH